MILFTISFCYSQVMIYVDKENFKVLKDNFKSIDLVGFVKDKEYLLNFSPKDFLKVKELKVDYKIFVRKETKTDYKTLSQYYSYIDSLVMKYNGITVLETLGFTYNNNPLVIIKINGKDPQHYSKEKTFLLMALHHAREWQTTVTALFFAESLLASYGNDSLITSLIDKNFIIIYPIVNPDGYYYSHDDPSGNSYWRKNRSYRNGYYGVDLNRNYGGGCNRIVQSDWGYPSGITHNPADDWTYCGPYPSSEREVQSVENLIKSYDVKISLSLHSYGQVVLYPWASVYNLTLDEDIIRNFAFKIASSMRKNDSSPYDTLRSVALYATTGDADDWIYGYSKFVKGKTTIPFTIEMDEDFQPPSSTLDSLCRKVFPGFLQGLILVDGLDGNLNEIPLKPDPAIINDTLVWSLTNKEYAEYYKVKLYSDGKSFIDTLSSMKNYRITNVHLDSLDYLSPNFSFHPENMNNSFSIIETNYKRMYGQDDTFFISLKYDLEKDHDVLLLEYTKDLLEYLPIDTLYYKFTGTDFIWRNLKIPFKGDSGFINIRIRTLFDPSTLANGVWIDDIGYITSFFEDTLYKDSILDTFMFIEIPPVLSSKNKFFEITPYDENFGYTISSDYIEYLFPLSIPPIFYDTVRLFDYSISFDFTKKDLIFKSFYPSNKKIELKIFNILGSIVYRKEFLLSDLEIINLGFLKSGKYFLVTSDDGKKRNGLLILK